MLRTTLRQIEIFVATAQRGSVTQAAKSVGLTQSAASMALADFENQLGTRLFNRIGKRLSLNEDGRALYAKAVEMVDRAREMESFFHRRERAMELRLGASTTIGNYLLPQIMGRFGAAYPDSRLELKVDNTWHVIDAIRNFEIDLGFVEGPCVDPDIDALFWQHDELAICASPHHPLAQRDSLDKETLREAGWILRERGSGTREVVEQMLTSQLGPIRLEMELGGTEAIKRAVESGMGISCLPKVALSRTIGTGDIVLLPVPSLQLIRAFYVLLHKQKYRTEGLVRFLGFCNISNISRAPV